MGKKRTRRTLAKLEISVSQDIEKKHLPVLMIYSARESTTASIDEEEAYRFINGNHREQMEMIMDTFSDIFELI